MTETDSQSKTMMSLHVGMVTQGRKLLLTNELKKCCVIFEPIIDEE